MIPEIIKGASHIDPRGTLFFNNDFDANAIKRIYFIENQDNSIVRAWQGHKIEQRWFSVIMGSFKIQLIAIEDWDKPLKTLQRISFIIHSETLDILHIPGGYVTSIQSLEEGSKLLVMADYLLGELTDEYRYPTDYFE